MTDQPTPTTRQDWTHPTRDTSELDAAVLRHREEQSDESRRNLNDAARRYNDVTDRLTVFGRIQ